MSWIIIPSGLALLLFVGLGYLIKGRDLIGICFCLFAGLVFLVGSHFISYYEGESRGRIIGVKIGIRARLNEPVDDKARLYGYAVRNKSYIKKRINDETPEKAEYLLELEDTISAFSVILDKVEVSKEVYDEVESGLVYPSGEPAGPQE